METIAHRLPGSGVASAGVRLGAGWSHDPPAQRGLAHLLEHTQVLAGRRLGSLDEALLPLGTSLDGRTLAERTLLFVDCLRGDLAAALPALMEAAFAPSFPPAQVALEREVVAASIPSREDFPPWQWARLLLDDALYGWDEFGALGSPGSVLSIPRDLLVEWHARHAVPSRCALCVSGDVAPEEVALLAAPWAPERAPTAASVLDPSPAPPRGGARTEHRPDLRPELWLGFPIPPDVPAGAVEILRAVLSNQPGSLLWERLRERAPLAYAVDAEVRAEPRGWRIAL